MKHLTFILLLTLVHSVVFSQIPDQQANRQKSWDALKDTTLRTPTPKKDTALYRDFPLNYKLDKKEFKQQKIVDSLFNTGYNFLPYALKFNYDRIVITVIKTGLLSDEKTKIIDVKKTIEELKLTKAKQ